MYPGPDLPSIEEPIPEPNRGSQSRSHTVSWSPSMGPYRGALSWHNIVEAAISWRQAIYISWSHITWSPIMSWSNIVEHGSYALLTSSSVPQSVLHVPSFNFELMESSNWMNQNWIESINNTYTNEWNLNILTEKKHSGARVASLE